MSSFDSKPGFVSRCILPMAALSLALGCASPGPPHAPSLNLPRQASDLTVRRIGDRVELRFTAPSRTTDNLPLPDTPIRGVFCRQIDRRTCIPVGGPHTLEPSRLNSRSVAEWEDVLPPGLAHGSHTLLGYRVELFNTAQQSAGKSDAAYTVSGEAPSPVEGLQVEGTRLGVLLHWNAVPKAAQEILISREDLAASAKPASSRQASPKHDAIPPSDTAELLVSASDAARNRVLDITARPDHPYRYSAVRRTTVQLGGHTIELSSAASDALSFQLHLVYPPLAPTGLTAVGFPTEATATAPPGFAVDLIWQPVSDAGLLAGLAGYNVYRQGTGARARLNTAPVQVPAFHDATANATDRYTYTVTAVDGKGNESPAATATLEPDARP